MAFSRQQPLQPKPTDVSEIIAGSVKFLLRSLSDDIHLETEVGDDVWLALIDPYQLENALLNLALNARDALPNGGSVKISVHNAELTEEDAIGNDDVPAGRYVKLVVTDTGSGMPAEVVDRAFEPFFSTKQTGQGTGLGLSMVYGFIKQSGGHVEIESQPGGGTTATMFLPRAKPGASVDRPSTQSGSHRSHSGQIILVAEDDAEVRRVTVEMLNYLGYRTLEAKDGPEALQILGEQTSVDLLFTDVVMAGGLNGRELAQQAQISRPGLKTLFASGYSQAAVIRDGKLDEGVKMISKPYNLKMLAQVVSDVLEQDESGCQAS